MSGRPSLSSVQGVRVERAWRCKGGNAGKAQQAQTGRTARARASRTTMPASREAGDLRAFRLPVHCHAIPLCAGSMRPGQRFEYNVLSQIQSPIKSMIN